MLKQQTVAAELGRFLSRLKFDEIPPGVIEKSKICLLDAIGTGLEGYRFDPVSIAFDVAEETSNGGVATLWGRGTSVGVLPAAFANCVAIHALLHDDTLMSSWSHPAGPVIASAIAVAEAWGVSGRQTLLGIIAGYEVMGRLGGSGAIAFDGIRRGFRANSTYGVFGAAAAAAKMLELDETQYANALACAASFANGLIEPLHAGSMEWRHETGVAAQNGIQAALLARRGLRAASTAFEGKFGFWRAFGGATEAPASATAGLGDSYEISQTFHKPYPTASEYTWNSAMYVTHQLVLRNKINYHDVERAEVKVMAKMLTYPGLAYSGPYENIDQAIASKPFAIAALLRNASFTSEVYRSQLTSPEILALARRVRVTGSDEWSDEWRCLVNIVTKDGRTFTGDEKMVERSIFYPDSRQIVEKFRAMVSETPFGSRCSEIASLVFSLDSATTVKPLTSALASTTSQ